MLGMLANAGFQGADLHLFSVEGIPDIAFAEMVAEFLRVVLSDRNLPFSAARRSDKAEPQPIEFCPMWFYSNQFLNLCRW